MPPDLSSNPYFQSFATLGPVTAAPSPSPLRFFKTEGRNLFRERLLKREERSTWLMRYPLVITPLRFDAFSDEVPGERMLFEWSASDRAPWWVDPLRFEISALLLAEGQSLKGYKPGACWKGYSEGLAALDWAPLASGMKPVPADEKELQNWEPWKSANRDVPAWGPAFSKAWPAENPVVELRKLESKAGEGDRYLARLTNGTLAEYREISAESPEGGTQWKSPPDKTAKPFASGCDRFLATARSWRADTKCLTVAKKSFSLEVWKKTPPKELREGRFENAAALSKQAGALCRVLGAYHGKQLRIDQAQELRALLEKNPPFAGRLERAAVEESELVLQAYRALVTTRPTPP